MPVGRVVEEDDTIPVDDSDVPMLSASFISRGCSWLWSTGFTDFFALCRFSDSLPHVVSEGFSIETDGEDNPTPDSPFSSRESSRARNPVAAMRCGRGFPPSSVSPPNCCPPSDGDATASPTVETTGVVPDMVARYGIGNSEA